MLSPGIRYVVGIDIAKRSHVVCALDARTGKVHLRPRSFAATAAGYAELRALLQAWDEPGAILLGLEATGCLWEPLYEDLTQAGYTVLVLNPRQTVAWAASLGLRAKTDGIDAHTLARGLLAATPREAPSRLRPCRSCAPLRERAATSCKARPRPNSACATNWSSSSRSCPTRPPSTAL